MTRNYQKLAITYLNLDIAICRYIGLLRVTNCAMSEIFSATHRITQCVEADRARGVRLSASPIIRAQSAPN